MRLLILTDLDGTLLDHETYDFAPAQPMLARLAHAQVPVILASSKTAAEIAFWQERLGLGAWPAIVENGAALHDGAQDDSAYRRIRAALAALRAPLRGFGAMSTAEITAVTGLSPAQAALAQRRQHTEPGIWSGTDEELAHFCAALEAQGITVRRGGRFLTLGWGGSKAGWIPALRARFRPDVVIALGDAPNDAEMIAAADRGVIVRNDHGPGLPPMPGESHGRILRSTASGPAGWAEGIGRILADLGH